jgi:hypothetical protein
MSEGSDEFSLPITSEGVVRLVPRLRERYLTEHVETAAVQAVGYHLKLTVWSDRENVDVRLPLDGYRAERPYTRSITSWGVNVNRWRTPGKKSGDDGRTGWHNDASLDIGYGSQSTKPMIAALVETFQGVKPDL